jgi:hypothetical protein
MLKKIIKESLDYVQYEKWVGSLGSVKVVGIGSVVPDVSPDLMISNFSEYSKLMKLKKLLGFIKANAQPNECFHNAANTHLLLQEEGFDSKFVLGFLVESDKKFGHGWVKLNNIYFDPTIVEPKGNYLVAAELEDRDKIMGLSVFNPDEKCEDAFHGKGETYDHNGNCSVYPYFRSYFLRA